MKERVVLIDFLNDGHHAVYASTLLNGLHSAGYEVIFIGTSALIDQLSSIVLLNSGIECISIKQRSFSGVLNEINKLFSFKDALIEISKLKPDIIHFLQLDRFMFGICLSRLLFNNIRLVSTLHWCGVILANNLTLKSHINSILFRHLLRNSKVISHSRETNNIIVGTLKNNLHYAPYPMHEDCLDLDSILKKKALMRADLGVAESDKLLLCFGGARYDKGLDTAIDALRFLDISYRLLIAGKEEDFTQTTLMMQAEKLGVSDRILFRMVFIEERKVIDYFCASDCVLVPYKLSFTGQSGPLVYAASIGIPVIGSTAPIIKETIDEYRLGKVFNAGDAYELASAITTCDLELRNPVLFKDCHSQARFCQHVIEAYTIG
ncbi:MAG: glycosyltransferase [Geobacter sp.]|nr:glycosyltransferase [Geobacter sp.]